MGCRNSAHSARIWLLSLVGGLTACAQQTSLGALTFSGDVSLNTGSPTAPVMVGRQTVGSLRLDNGSSLTSGSTLFGVNATGIGFGVVTGPRTSWVMATADVGLGGIGRLDIDDGAMVETPRLLIGTQTGSNGAVAVKGAGSTLQIRSASTGSLAVGGPGNVAGVGRLEVSDGAIVNATLTQTSIGRSGRVTLDGGLLRASGLMNEGLISGSGEIQLVQNGVFFQAGRVEVGDGDHLIVSGTGGMLQNFGVFAADGGELEILRPLNNGRQGTALGGEVTLRNGTIRIGSSQLDGPQFTNTGLLVALGGENHFYGRVQTVPTSPMFAPEIAVTNNSVLVFHDDVSLLGGMMTVFAGSKATLLEDLMLSTGAQLLADISGSSIDTEYGEIEVVGNVQLGGQLLVALSDGFTPSAGDSFPIIKAAGGISGELALGPMSSLPNHLAWDLQIGPNQVVLNVVPALPGDYNTDGAVDAADFVLWRQSRGQTGSGLAADGNFDGSVDAADYDVWRSHFGTTRSGGTEIAQTASVPEPSATVLFWMAALMAIGRMRPIA